MDDLLDRIIQVFHDNGLFEKGVQLIGSWCYRYYQVHLGAPKYPLRTQDVDFLIPYPYQGPRCSLGADLAKVGFRCEFNTDGSMHFSNPIGLRFMGILTRDSITIDDGKIPVRVPSPESFCLHKFVIAQKRRKEDKKIKDAEQAVLVSTIADRTKLSEIYLTLPKAWRSMILSTLKESREYFRPVVGNQATKTIVKTIQWCVRPGRMVGSGSSN